MNLKIPIKVKHDILSQIVYFIFNNRFLVDKTINNSCSCRNYKMCFKHLQTYCNWELWKQSRWLTFFEQNVIIKSINKQINNLAFAKILQLQCLVFLWSSVQSVQKVSTPLTKQNLTTICQQSLKTLDPEYVLSAWVQCAVEGVACVCYHMSTNCKRIAVACHTQTVGDD